MINFIKIIITLRNVCAVLWRENASTVGITFTIMMIFPTLLNTLHSTVSYIIHDCIPSHNWSCLPTVLNSLHSTDDILNDIQTVTDLQRQPMIHFPCHPQVLYQSNIMNLNWCKIKKTKIKLYRWLGKLTDNMNEIEFRDFKMLYYLVCSLQWLPSFDEDSILCSDPSTNHDSCRGGKAKGTGTCYGKHRDCTSKCELECYFWFCIQCALK